MPKNNAKYLILDTHVWIWLMNADKRIDHQKYLKIIAKYAKNDAIRVSLISVWELGMLASKGRISLSLTIRQWIEQSLSAQGLSFEPLTLDILLESSMIQAHGDPADRMILSTAKQIKATVMTADEQMIKYCLDSHQPVIVIK